MIVVGHITLYFSNETLLNLFQNLEGQVACIQSKLCNLNVSVDVSVDSFEKQTKVKTQKELDN